MPVMRARLVMVSASFDEGPHLGSGSNREHAAGDPRVKESQKKNPTRGRPSDGPRACDGTGPAQELRQLGQVLGQQRASSADLVAPDRAVILGAFFHDPAQRAVTLAADAHLHQHLGQIGEPQIALRQPAQHRVVIGGDAERGVIGAVIVEDLAAQEQRGMRRHPAAFQQFRPVGSRLPVADDAAGVILSDVFEIAVDSVDIAAVEGFGDAIEHGAMREQVVRVQDANDIALRHSNSLVERIVNALIRFAEQGHLRCCKFFHYSAGLIARGAIDHDELLFSVALT